MLRVACGLLFVVCRVLLVVRVSCFVCRLLRVGCRGLFVALFKNGSVWAFSLLHVLCAWLFLV